MQNILIVFDVLRRYSYGWYPTLETDLNETALMLLTPQVANIVPFSRYLGHVKESTQAWGAG
jgi:hypothetical protein